MKKSTLLKLVSLVICAMMLLSMFAACEDEPVETDAPGTDPVETPTGETEPGPDETEPKETEPKETTPPAPTCDGDHSVQYDEEGHWRDACEEHGVPAVSKVSHAYRYDDDGVYCCNVCKYEPACEGEHWVTDAAGHSQPACEDCGFAGDPEVAGEHEYDDDLVCTICGYAPECYGEHEYEANGADGHIVKACEFCGAPAGELEPHSIVEDYEEVGGDKEYTYFCSLCGYVIKTRTIPANVNAYLSGVELASSAAFQSTASIVQGAYHLDFDGKHSQHIWLREAYLHPNGSGTMAGGGGSMTEKIDAAKAQYMLVRVKTNSAALIGGGKFQIYLSTTGWNHDTEGVTGIGAGSVCKDMNFQVSEADTWTVFVADLKTIDKFVVPDADGNYIFDTFYFNYSSNKAGEYLELDYVAFVDNWEEAQALFTEEDEIIRKVLDFSGNFELLNADGTAHTCVDADANNACDQCGAHVHSYKTLANKCDACGEITEHTCVDTDADAQHLCDLCGNCAHAYTTLANKCDHCGTITEHACVDATDPKDYKCDLCGEHVHGYSTLANKCDNCGEISKHDCVDADVNTSCDLCGEYVAPPVTGDFIVNKVLTGADLAVGAPYQGAQADVEGIYTLTHNHASSGAFQHLWLREGYYTNQANHDAGVVGNPSGQMTDPTIDIGKAQYMVVKIRTSLATGIQFMLGTTAWTYEQQTAWGQGGIYTAVTVKPGASEDYTIFVIPLSLCGDKAAADADGNRVLDTFMISATAANLSADKIEIEYIAFVDDWNEVGMVTGNATVKNVTATNGTTEDVAVTVPELGDGAVNKNLTAADLAVAGPYQATASNENGIYHFVMPGKNASQHLWIREGYYKDAAAAAAANGVPPTGTNNIPNIEIGKAQYMVVKIKTNAANSIGFFMGSTAYTYVDAGTKYGQGNIYSSVSVKPGATEEWTIYVIPLSLYGERAQADADGNRVIDTFMLNYGANNADEYIDIEYIAFVDAWAEVSLVTGTAQVNKVVDTKGTVELAQVTATTPEA